MPVILHVYDFEGIGMMNEVFRKRDTGVYHCGVEVFRVEWAFFCCPDPSAGTGSGVVCCLPGNCPGFVYRESAHMGCIRMSEQAFCTKIKLMCMEWQANQYDLLKRNCIHFAVALCQVLGVGKLPGWLTHSTEAGEQIHAIQEGCTCCKRTAVARAAFSDEWSEWRETQEEFECIQQTPSTRRELIELDHMLADWPVPPESGPGPAPGALMAGPSLKYHVARGVDLESSDFSKQPGEKECTPPRASCRS